MSTTTTTPHAHVALPAGAAAVDDWTPDHPQPYRIIFGVNRRITGHAAKGGTSAVQWADGSVDDGRVEAPSVYVHGLGETTLNSDQARELASVLLEAAAEVDGWAAR
jgi:hypothetical protein